MTPEENVSPTENEAATDAPAPGKSPGSAPSADTSGRERLAFVGDSITASGRWGEWFPDAEILVGATGGDTTEKLVDRLPAIVEFQPDVIVLLIGANDFGGNRSVEYVVRSIEYFLAMVRQELPGARTLVQSIMPRGREYASDIKDANRHLRQYAQNVYAQYLDLWPALAMDDGELSAEYTGDRLHLNEAGYQAWLGELYPALERIKDAPPMSRPISIIHLNQ